MNCRINASHLSESKPVRLTMKNLGFGVGLRTPHFPYLMSHDDLLVDWFEIISENFMSNYGYARHVLQRITKQYPVVMHGVSMNIGSHETLNWSYLEQLKALADFVKPEWISDHLCWTGVAGVNSHDLLPLPLTESVLEHVACRVNSVQDFLKRPLILENPSTYIEFQQSELTEWEFLSALVEKTQCGLLLDVNNVYVSAHNHGFCAVEYINNLPHRHIVQLHIAGPTDVGDCLVDTHDHPVPNEVWALYSLAQQLTGGVATLLEWDANIPDYVDLVTELNKAKAVLSGETPEPVEIMVDDAISKVVSTPIVI
ncbi:DUF692 domain-containing protein [Aliikangiella maris]|uniref:DUF692 domain-containing protein n=2 Tax=Aliikangiella maris TaxID=3162458 RepID=A0ABV3MNT3_9GAMM